MSRVKEFLDAQIGKVVSWVKAAWRQRLRGIDHLTLFPAMQDGADTHEHFLRAVRFHMTHDEAWNVDREELNARDRELWDEAFE